jgi:hypothetical protein
LLALTGKSIDAHIMAQRQEQPPPEHTEDQPAATILIRLAIESARRQQQVTRRDIVARLQIETGTAVNHRCENATPQQISNQRSVVISALIFQSPDKT